MLSEGLIEETKKLMEMGVFDANKTAAQAIGYKELFSYLKGEEEKEIAIETLKRATRKYAKRQITWFSAKDYVTPLFADDGENIKSFEEIVNIAENIFRI
jgi:tRNA dimethylallyltransferase